MPYTINDKETFDRLNRRKPVDTRKVRAAQEPSRMSGYIKQDIRSIKDVFKNLPGQSKYPKDWLTRGESRPERVDTQGTSQPQPVNLDLGRTAQERGFTSMSARPERTPLAGPAQTPTTNNRAVPDRTVVTNTLPSNPNTLMQTPQSRDLLAGYENMNPQQLQERIDYLNKNDMIPGNTHIIRGMNQEFNEWGTGKKFDTYVDFLRGKTAEDRAAEGAALDRQTELEKERIKAGAKQGGQDGMDSQFYKVAVDQGNRAAEQYDLMAEDPTPEGREAARNAAFYRELLNTGQADQVTNPNTGQRAIRLKNGTLVDAETYQPIQRQAGPQASVGYQFNPMDRNQNMNVASNNRFDFTDMDVGRNDRKDNRTVRRFDNSWFNRMS